MGFGRRLLILEAMKEEMVPRDVLTYSILLDVCAKVGLQMFFSCSLQSLESRVLGLVGSVCDRLSFLLISVSDAGDGERRRVDPGR